MYRKRDLSQDMDRKEIFRTKDVPREKSIVRDVSDDMYRKRSASQERCIAREMYRKEIHRKRDVSQDMCRMRCIAYSTAAFIGTNGCCKTASTDNKHKEQAQRNTNRQRINKEVASWPAVPRRRCAWHGKFIRDMTQSPQRFHGYHPSV